MKKKKKAWSIKKETRKENKNEEDE